MSKWIHILVLITVLVSATPAFSLQADEKSEIHGFGSWQYGDTDGNRYLSGEEDGNYEDFEFALAVAAHPYERLTIDAQLFWESEGEEEIESTVDYAFATWAFSDSLKFRIGVIKHPFGIYSEIFDVGTIRPFLHLPQGVYGPTGIAAESFNGAGVTGYLFGGVFQYDLYGGGLRATDFQPWEALEGADPVEAEDRHIKNMLGGRVILTTPFSGLSAGLSAYTGKMEVEEEEEKTATVYGAHVEYLTNALWFRAEAVHKKEAAAYSTNAAYAEVAYKLTPHWQAGTRYDWTEAEPEEELDEGESLLEHKDLAFAVNYWFTPAFVLKLEYHRVDGNRFAVPEDIAAAVAGGGLKTKTKLIQFGAQFSF